jgi:hypothetical protein
MISGHAPGHIREQFVEAVEYLCSNLLRQLRRLSEQGAEVWWLTDSNEVSCTFPPA